MACGSCGAPGLVGTICAYCGNMIVAPQPTNTSKRKTKRDAISDGEDYYVTSYRDFWNRLLEDDFVPTNIFKTFEVTDVYNFWIPKELICRLEMLTEEDIIRQLREYYIYPSYVYDLPLCPKESRRRVVIIDFKYRNKIYTYVNLQGFNSRNSKLSSYNLSLLPFENSWLVGEKRFRERTLGKELDSRQSDYERCKIVSFFSGFCLIGFGIYGFSRLMSGDIYGLIVLIICASLLRVLWTIFFYFNNKYKTIKGRVVAAHGVVEMYEAKRLCMKGRFKGKKMTSFVKYREENLSPLSSRLQPWNY